MPFEEGKIRPRWPIRISTEENFREMVVRKHGFYAKGLLGYELDKAMNLYMRRYLRPTSAQVGNKVAHTLLNFEKTAQQQTAVQLRNDIVRFLVDSGICEGPPDGVPLPMLKRAICAVTGVKDARAIKSRLTLLQSHLLIKLEDWVSQKYAIVYGQYDDNIKHEGHTVKLQGKDRGLTNKR